MNEEKKIDFGPTRIPTRPCNTVEKGGENKEESFLRGTATMKNVASDERHEEQRQPTQEQSDDESNSSGSNANNKRNVNARIGPVVKDTSKVVQKGLQQAAQGGVSSAQQSVGNKAAKTTLGNVVQSDNENHDENAMNTVQTTTEELNSEDEEDSPRTEDAAAASDLLTRPQRFQKMLRKRAQQVTRLGIPSSSPSSATNSKNNSPKSSPKPTSPKSSPKPTSPKTMTSNLNRIISRRRILGPRRGQEPDDDARSELSVPNLPIMDDILPPLQEKHKKEDVVVAAREAVPTTCAVDDDDGGGGGFDKDNMPSTSSNAVVSSAQQNKNGISKAGAASEPDESHSSSVNNNHKNDTTVTVCYIVCAFLSLTVACFQTWRHWSPSPSSEEYHRLPLSVTVAWMICAYITGSTITHITTSATSSATTSINGSSSGGRRRSGHVSDKTHNVVIGEDDYVDVYPTESLGNHGQNSKKNGPSKVIFYIWSKVTTRLSRNKRVEEQLEQERQQQLVRRRESWTMLNPPKEDDGNRSKRNLRKKRFRLPKWQRSIDPLKCYPIMETDTESDTDADDGVRDNRTRRESSNPLMHKLLSERSLSRIPRRLSAIAQATLETTKEKFGTTRRLGDFTRSGAMAYTLDDYVIDPFLSLRGMDVFINSAEGDEIDESLRGSLGSHPWFIQNGLRAVPTLIINILFSWGNIVVYFEMPSWVTDFQDALVEKPDDAPNVTALKRFLNRSDDYRNDRLKCIPSLVTGPLAVRMLAPPKREVGIHGAVIPLTWHCHDADDHYEMPAVRGEDDISNTTTSDSSRKAKKLCPVIECELDCLSGRAIRSMAGIVKRHLSSLVVDLALVIGPATEAEDAEEPATDDSDNDPHACLGMWRFNRIDVASCPEFPDRTVYAIKEDLDAVVSRHVDLDKRRASDRREILMASRLIGLESDELKEIMAAEEE